MTTAGHPILALPSKMNPISTDLQEVATSAAHSRKRRRKDRQASVYDAVAGRIGLQGFKPELELLETDPAQFWARDKVNSLRPDEALFRGPNMPTRYAEDDLYEHDRHIPSELELPDSDLLKAVHAYAADFYDRQFPKNAKYNQRSMDETALLAMGYLLEEAANQALGETGDMALVEGEVADGDRSVEDQGCGFTYDDLPGVKSTQSTQFYFREKLHKNLGFMRFTHDRPVPDAD